MAESEEELQSLLMKVKVESEKEIIIGTGIGLISRNDFLAKQVDDGML